MKLPENLRQQLRMMMRGQLIVSGGGLTVTQLPSGQYQISITSGDLLGNSGRTPGGGGSGGSDGDVPGEPVDPNRHPNLPVAPPLPPGPTDESGVYGGGNQRRRVRGARSESTPDEPYDFNQRGWQWYLDNF